MALNDRVGASLATFCATVPLETEHEARLALDTWPIGAESPLAKLPATHFARFVIVPELHREAADQPADVLQVPYLVFSAFFDGERDAFLTALCELIADDVHAVFRHCRGYPGHPARAGATFRRWLEDHRVPATAMFGAYADASVQKIREALAFRRAFREFAFGLQATGADQAAFTAFAEKARA